MEPQNAKRFNKYMDPNCYYRQHLVPLENTVKHHLDEVNKSANAYNFAQQNLHILKETDAFKKPYNAVKDSAVDAERYAQGVASIQILDQGTNNLISYSNARDSYEETKKKLSQEYARVSQSIEPIEVLFIQLSTLMSTTNNIADGHQAEQRAIANGYPLDYMAMQQTFLEYDEDTAKNNKCQQYVAIVINIMRQMSLMYDVWQKCTNPTVEDIRYCGIYQNLRGVLETRLSNLALLTNIIENSEFVKNNPLWDNTKMELNQKFTGNPSINLFSPDRVQTEQNIQSAFDNKLFKNLSQLQAFSVYPSSNLLNSKVKIEEEVRISREFQTLSGLMFTKLTNFNSNIVNHHIIFDELEGRDPIKMTDAIQQLALMRHSIETAEKKMKEFIDNKKYDKKNPDKISSFVDILTECYSSILQVYASINQFRQSYDMTVEQLAIVRGVPYAEDTATALRGFQSELTNLQSKFNLSEINSEDAKKRKYNEQIKNTIISFLPSDLQTELAKITDASPVKAEKKSIRRSISALFRRSTTTHDNNGNNRGSGDGWSENYHEPKLIQSNSTSAHANPSKFTNSAQASNTPTKPIQPSVHARSKSVINPSRTRTNSQAVNRQVQHSNDMNSHYVPQFIKPSQINAPTNPAIPQAPSRSSMFPQPPLNIPPTMPVNNYPPAPTNSIRPTNIPARTSHSTLRVQSNSVAVNHASTNSQATTGQALFKGRLGNSINYNAPQPMQRSRTNAPVNPVIPQAPSQSSLIPQPPSNRPTAPGNGHPSASTNINTGQTRSSTPFQSQPYAPMIFPSNQNNRNNKPGFY